ncbi:NADH-quinone oxidoreductase subunit NuoG [Caulobacter sp. S45]|uniref:NADH-quinone oxidoreductase subunit NuoG n=1 Tax=Caulobacter sp. S45 TaxID=1641861 RepID=UPI00131EB2A3|nr:NADH-quinone oxidoreductase subunit NuoG [Caulobacter sp. S45]
MPTAKVNGKEIEFEAGLTVLQVAELAGEEIPRFCYHERLSIAGNCRMCLVEVKPGPPKPQASCALPAADKQEIFTNTPMVKKAREGVMEFLLINHPLDCPICDQGGECDLQDEAIGYGRDGSRYAENKRAVEEKFLGPLIKTTMTRCIQCTRCVRFSTEIAGVSEMGMISRGEDAEITSYLEEALTSELSGNLADICPVGALTHKPWAFNYRPWELTKTESVDVMDAVGSAIRVDARGGEVMRILPRVNEDINEEWISDKTRYVPDGLMRQRLDRPYVRVDGKLKPATWAEAFAAVAGRIRAVSPDKVGVIAGDLQDAESMKAAMDLFSALGVKNLDCRQDGAKLGYGPRESWLFNTTIAGIEKLDRLLLVGTNLRKEAPLVNARIRKAWLTGKLRVGVIGEHADLRYSYEYFGAGPSSLQKLVDGEGDFFKDAKGAAIVLGQGALIREDSSAILNLAAKAAGTFGMTAEGKNGFNVLHTAASRVAGLDMGFVPKDGGRHVAGMIAGAGKGEIEVLVLMGADEIDTTALGNAFVVYIGSHGDAGANRADVILPGAAYTEKPGIYVNTEGRVQIAARAVFPKGEAREDWAILRALSEHLGAKLAYDSLEQLRAKLMANHPTFGQVDYAPGAASAAGLDLGAFGEAGSLSDAVFASPIDDFYLTNPIARASVTMAECSASQAQALGRLQAAE